MREEFSRTGDSSQNTRRKMIVAKLARIVRITVSHQSLAIVLTAVEHQQNAFASDEARTPQTL